MKVKKYLGQHFLKNKKILREMVRVAEISNEDTVLEIGPGHGELTGFLAASAKKVIAVEKDRELIPVLKKKFADVKNVKIISGDIRNLKLEIRNYKVAANIPYYLTSRFLRMFLTQIRFRPKLMVLMVQYEVAKRIMARPPEMNLLALSVQAYAKPQFIRKVSRKYFYPQPKVDSAIIKIANIKPGGFDKLFKLARRAFQQKRKMLRHSLKSDSDVTSESDFGKKRPQELSLEDWKKIMKF